jgi:hypothetical protein
VPHHLPDQALHAKRTAPSTHHSSPFLASTWLPASASHHRHLLHPATPKLIRCRLQLLCTARFNKRSTYGRMPFAAGTPTASATISAVAPVTFIATPHKRLLAPHAPHQHDTLTRTHHTHAASSAHTGRLIRMHPLLKASGSACMPACLGHRSVHTACRNNHSHTHQKVLSCGCHKAVSAQPLTLIRSSLCTLPTANLGLTGRPSACNKVHARSPHAL